MPANRGNLFHRFFNSYLFLFASIIVAVMVIFSYSRTYYQEYQVQQEINRLQADARKLETKKLELLDALRYVKSSSFVEEKARTDLNMAKTGEKMLLFEASGSSSVGSRQSENNVVVLNNTSNYFRWWNYFMEEAE
jgi:cell division protein FtsB